MFSRAVKLIPCPSTAGEMVKANKKVFVVLNQASLHTSFPSQIGPLALLCRLLALHACFLVQALLTFMASRSSCQFIWSDGARDTPRLVGLCLDRMGMAHSRPLVFSI